LRPGPAGWLVCPPLYRCPDGSFVRPGPALRLSIAAGEKAVDKSSLQRRALSLAQASPLTKCCSLATRPAAWLAGRSAQQQQAGPPLLRRLSPGDRPAARRSSPRRINDPACCCSQLERRPGSSRPQLPPWPSMLCNRQRTWPVVLWGEGVRIFSLCTSRLSTVDLGRKPVEYTQMHLSDRTSHVLEPYSML
jgi:hypothetical protein